MLAETDSLGFNDQIQQAIEIIESESIDLEADQLQELRDDLIRAKKCLDELDISGALVGEVKDLLKIRTKSINSIFSLAVKKFEKEESEASMCLFLFLSKLDSEDPEYLYRAGIAAQICGKLELALKIYAETLNISSDLIGPKIFSIECQFDLGFKESALKMHEDLKQELINLTIEEKWIPILEDIENSLTLPAS
ncbi:MAG: hypothetical protein H0V82_10265 [Candidatus Protochlamydia sp.]|nr:hypothetical protein [Candidatus Protochlamydia sp.]